MNSIRKVTLCLLAWALVPAAMGGPCWVELGEAGPLPPSGELVMGSDPNGGEALACILGMLDAAQSDFQDVYLIFINDPVNFSARTLADIGGHVTDFDTQLWLFDADPTNIVNARGLLGNNDDPNLPNPAFLSLITPPATDGTAQTIPGPGRYYLAISGGDGLSGANVGSVPTDAGNQDIFNQASTTEISGPDGPGGNNLFAGWTTGGVTGSYAIEVLGAQFLSPRAVPTGGGSSGILTALVVLAAGALALRGRGVGGAHDSA